MTKKMLSHRAGKIVQQSHIGEYRTHYGAEHVFPVTGVSAIGIGVLLGGAFSFFSATLLSILSMWQVAVVLLIAFSWVAVGIWLISSSLIVGAKMVVVCERGLLCRDHKVWELFLWHEIAAIWCRPIESTSLPRYEVERTDGYFFVFDSSLPQAEQLKHMLEREILCRLFAHCLDQYRQNYTITFGPVGLNQQGVCVAPHKRVLPWCELKYIDAFNGVVYIRLKQQSDNIASIPLSSIPNSCVLESLVRHIHRVHREMHMRQVAIIPKRPLSVSQEPAIW